MLDLPGAPDDVGERIDCRGPAAAAGHPSRQPFARRRAAGVCLGGAERGGADRLLGFHDQHERVAAATAMTDRLTRALNRAVLRIVVIFVAALVVLFEALHLWPPRG